MVATILPIPTDESKSLNLPQAAAALRRGELVIYPTETFYALGCDARNPKAVARLLAVKGREPGKPLPLVVGEVGHLQGLTVEVSGYLDEIMTQFWPGPLTICLPATAVLPPGVVSEAGEIAVRVPGHAGARALALALGGPLVSTSANLAGAPPASRAAAIAPAVLAQTAGVLQDATLPGGGAPSTIVRPIGNNTLECLREGAIPRTRLQALGWRVR